MSNAFSINSRNSLVRVNYGYRKPIVEAKPWFNRVLTDDSNPLPHDKLFTEPRIIFIDETAFARSWSTEKLLTRRPKLEIGEDDCEWKPKYLLTYSSDTDFAVRTLISKQIAGLAAFTISFSAEPPLSYSDVNFSQPTGAVNGEIEPIDANAGKRIFELLITKYRFRIDNSKKYGAWPKLIVDEGMVWKRGTFAGSLPPAPEFNRLWIDDKALYRLLKEKYNDVCVWECGNLGHGSVANEISENDNNAPANEVNSDNMTSSGDTGNASSMLSAFVAASITSSDLSGNVGQAELEDHAISNGKRKQIGIDDNAMLTMKRRRIGEIFEIDPDDGDDSNGSITIFAGTTRDQTGDVITISDVATALHDGSPPLIDLASPADMIDQGLNRLSDDSLDVLLRHNSVGTFTNPPSQHSNDSVEQVDEAVFGSRQDQEMIRDQLIDARMESNADNDGDVQAQITSGEPGPAIESGIPNLDQSLSDQDESAAGATTTSEKGSGEKKNLKFARDLKEAFRNIRLPLDLNQECIKILLEKS